MKTLIAIALLFTITHAVIADPKLPKGIIVKTDGKHKTEVILESPQAIIVRQPGKNGRTLLVGNVEGVMSVTQLEDEGDTPIGVEFFTAKKARVSVMRGSVIIVDQDGDGIPDIKIDKTGMYKLKRIIWEKVEKKK